MTQTQCQYHEGVQLPSVISLSCASASFCRAVESSTAEWNYDGAGWRPVTAGPGTFTADAVACPSASQCEGFDGNGLEAEDDGSGFGDLQLIGASDVDVSVSCASEGFCAAVDSAGDLVSGAAAGPLVTLTVRIDEDVDGRGDVTFAGPMAACRTSSYTPCTRAWRPGTAVQRLCPGDQPGAR